MNEEEISTRLLALEAKTVVLEDLLMSHQKALLGLMRALHEKGSLALPDVIARLQSTAAFGQAAFDKPPPRTYRALLQTLQAIADEYAKRGPPQ